MQLKTTTQKCDGMDLSLKEELIKLTYSEEEDEEDPCDVEDSYNEECRRRNGLPSFGSFKLEQI